MADEIRKEDIELTDEELENVAGGYTSGELVESKFLGITEGTCPIAAFNKLYKGK